MYFLNVHVMRISCAYHVLFMCFVFRVRTLALLLPETVSYGAGVRDQGLRCGAQVTWRLGCGLLSRIACIPSLSRFSQAPSLSLFLSISLTHTLSFSLSFYNKTHT